jgi:GntR family transcriptional repressor for pyruvate dehydrogenase complex
MEETFADLTAERITRYILVHDLARGSKLPSEKTLADLLQVGRSTLREAVRTLVTRNIVEVRQGSGTFVAAGRIGISNDPLGLLFIKDKQKLVRDLLEIRLLIEPPIAAMAARAATAADVRDLKQLAGEVELLINTDQDHTARDIAFHARIAESSGNIVMPNLMPVIQSGITLFVDMTRRSLRRETIDTHRAIVNAIAAHDPKTAAEAMTLHIAYNQRRLGELPATAPAPGRQAH